jgi:antitoxin component of MazEF toxin-antitoxin module
LPWRKNTRKIRTLQGGNTYFIALPKKILTEMQLNPGDEVLVALDDNKIIITKHMEHSSRA